MRTYITRAADRVDNLDPTLDWFDVVVYDSNKAGIVVAVAPSQKWADRIANALNQMEIES